MIKKSRRTLAYEQQFQEFLERSRESCNEVICDKHGMVFVRKDLEATCPWCALNKGDKQ